MGRPLLLASLLVLVTALAAAEDAYEDNDTFATANASLGFGTHSLHCADDDWFRFDLEPGRFRVRMDHTTGVGGQLNAVLYNASEAPVWSNLVNDGSEEFVFRVDNNGGATYWLKVAKEDPALADNDYTLVVTQDITTTGDDANEPNDSWRQPTALTTPNNTISGALLDEDWYRFPATGTGNVSLDLDYSGSGLELQVWDSNGNIRYLGAADGSGLSVSFPPDAALATVYAAIRYPQTAANETGPGTAYTLVTSQYTLVEDQYEDNDTRATAQPLAFGTYTSLGALDEDWFSFDCNVPGLFHVKLAHLDLGAGADLNVEIYDPQGNAVGADAQTSADEEVFYHVIVPGTYTVRVFPTAASGNTYSLTAERSYSATNDDGSEPNDHWSQATVLSTYHAAAGTFTERDEDWFTIANVPAGTLTITLGYNNANGELNLEIYNPDQSRARDAIANVGVISGGKQLSLDLDAPADVHFCVYGPVNQIGGRTEATGASYTVTLQHPLKWATTLDAGVAHASSPMLADVDGDGKLEILIGTQKHVDGNNNEIRPGRLYCLEHDGSVKWSFMPPAATMADPVTGKSYTSSGIATRPAVADIDGDGTLEVVFGTGADLLRQHTGTGLDGQPQTGPYDAGHKGGLYALDATTGNQEWYRQTKDLHGFAEGTDGLIDSVYASPVVCDLEGDGIMEVVFASWDHYTYVVDGRTGLDYAPSAPSRPAQWPINQHDTIWSTPLVADITNDGVPEILIGGDITENAAARTLTGGIFHVYDRYGFDVIDGFREYIDFTPDTAGAYSFYKGIYDEQTIWSSPIAGDLDGDGRLEIAYGTGLFKDAPIGEYIVVRQHDGSLYGRLATTGRTFAAPLFADLDGDGDMEIVAVTAQGYVHGWDHTGNQLFATNAAPYGGQGSIHPIYASPLAIDLDGDNDLELVLQQGNTVVVLDHLGNQLTSTAAVGMHNESFRGTPAIADLDGDGTLDIVTGGANAALDTGVVHCFRWLPNTAAASGRYARRMFRESGCVPISAAQQARRDQLTAFVTRFYRLLLGREPELAGLASWTTQIMEGQRAAGDIGSGFVLSPEFINRGLDNETFVRALYSAFFDRAADQGGLDDWLAQLAAGATRAAVMNGFIGAQEFINLSNTFGVTPSFTTTGGPNRVLVEEFVTRLYLFVLDRRPDAAGLAGWVDALLTGAQVGEQVAHAFFFSAEYLAKNVDEETFVNDLYRALFGRTADSGGFAGWVDFIRAARNDPVNYPDEATIRQTVLQGFVRPPSGQEFVNLTTFYGIIANLTNG